MSSPPMDASALSPQQLAQGLRGFGISTAEIARELDRSPRMVRKVLTGETTGEAYRETLTQLYTSGRATTRPPRRRDKTGQVVPVRAKVKGREPDAPAVIRPADTGGKYAPQPKRGRFSTDTTYLDEGGRLHEVTLPKTPRAKGREQARDEVMRILRSGARGQRWHRKRAKITVAYSNGRTMELGRKGGYNISDLLARSNAAGKNPLEYLETQMSAQGGQRRYQNFDPSKHQITGVNVTIYNAEDEAKISGAERKTK